MFLVSFTWSVIAISLIGTENGKCDMRNEINAAEKFERKQAAHKVRFERREKKLYYCPSLFQIE